MHAFFRYLYLKQDMKQVHSLSVIFSAPHLVLVPFLISCACTAVAELPDFDFHVIRWCEFHRAAVRDRQFIVSATTKVPPCSSFLFLWRQCSALMSPELCCNMMPALLAVEGPENGKWAFPSDTCKEAFASQRRIFYYVLERHSLFLKWLITKLQTFHEKGTLALVRDFEIESCVSVNVINPWSCILSVLQTWIWWKRQRVKISLRLKGVQSYFFWI